MGKRSNFRRRPQDAYFTPVEAVKPLLPFLPEPRTYTFWEPCAGDGALLDIIPAKSCAASDINPQDERILQNDALEYTPDGFDFIITNPPWTREILHPMIDKFRMIAPTWLLFDADWMHTKQAIPYLRYCHEIVSIGRVKWIPGSKSTGKDNCCWYKFSLWSTKGSVFHGRQE